MKISEDLKQQVERYERTRSFNLNNVLKFELAAWYRDTQGKTLNISCGTCIRNAMRDIVAFSKQATEPAIRRIPFKGIVEEKPKTIAEMTYKELRAMAKEQGIKGTLKREEYIALLSNA
jgi:hypothetical protein